MQYYEEKPECKENFEMGTVCQNLKKKVTVLGLDVNVWMIILVVVGVLLYVYRDPLQKQLDNMMESSAVSSTSVGLKQLNQQMGGSFSVTTPDFIRNL